MKHIFYLSIFLIFLSGCGNSQSKSSQQSLTGNIPSDLKTLLGSSTSTVKADIMDGISQSPRQLELTKKFQSAIEENYEWFVEYMKTIPEGEPMPYNEKLNMTKEEYVEMMNFMTNVELISTGKQDITIEVSEDLIRFKSDGKLAGLDSLIIDVKNNIVHFGQFRLSFADSLNITSEKNGLKSKWKGYSWKFEEPSNLNAIDLEDLSSLKILQYKFTIGQLEKNGKTHMSIEGRVVENGVRTLDFELPVQF